MPGIEYNPAFDDLEQGSPPEWMGAKRRINMATDSTATTGTHDEAHGKFQEVKGSIKEKIGQLTNDPNLEDEGTADKASGFVEKKVGQVKKVFGS